MVEEVRSHLTNATKEPGEADTALGAHEQLAAGEAPAAQEVGSYKFPAAIARPAFHFLHFVSQVVTSWLA